MWATLPAWPLELAAAAAMQLEAAHIAMALRLERVWPLPLHRACNKMPTVQHHVPLPNTPGWSWELSTCTKSQRVTRPQPETALLSWLAFTRCSLMLRNGLPSFRRLRHGVDDWRHREVRSHSLHGRGHAENPSSQDESLCPFSHCFLCQGLEWALR